MGDPKRNDREPTFRALGKFINRLGGTYITGEDVGTTLRDMEYIRMETEYVVTLPTYLGGAGDIAPMTAFGTIRAMEACCRRVYGSDSIEGKRVAVQGLGAVGHNIVGQLHERGAVLVITDIDQDKVDAMVAKYGTEIRHRQAGGRKRESRTGKGKGLPHLPEHGASVRDRGP